MFAWVSSNRGLLLTCVRPCGGLTFHVVCWRNKIEGPNSRELKIPTHFNHVTLDSFSPRKQKECQFIWLETNHSSK